MTTEAALSAPYNPDTFNPDNATIDELLAEAGRLLQLAVAAREIIVGNWTIDDASCSDHIPVIAALRLNRDELARQALEWVHRAWTYELIARLPNR